MDRQDEELNRILDSYTVEPATTELLERLVSQSTTAPSSRQWWKEVMLLAACAVLGFWSGNATIRTAQVTVASAGNVNFDQVILGPNTFSEVRL